MPLASQERVEGSPDSVAIRCTGDTEDTEDTEDKAPKTSRKRASILAFRVVSRRFGRDSVAIGRDSVHRRHRRQGANTKKARFLR